MDNYSMTPKWWAVSSMDFEGFVVPNSIHHIIDSLDYKMSHEQKEWTERWNSLTKGLYTISLYQKKKKKKIKGRSQKLLEKTHEDKPEASSTHEPVFEVE